MKPVYLLTGRTGTGKTSLIKQVVAGFRLKAGGFYTEEIRNSGTRLGFKLVTLDGREAVLAHIDFSKRFRVGKYGVDVTAMDSLGVPVLRHAARQDDLIIIDEIGKMEMFSPAFRETVLEIIGGNKRTLGTIMLNANPWADTIKKHPNVNLITVSRYSYSRVLAEVQDWLQVITN